MDIVVGLTQLSDSLMTVLGVGGLVVLGRILLVNMGA